jgi:hypothetical protein
MKRTVIVVDSDAALLDAQSTDAQLAGLAALLARATGSARVVPLDFSALEPQREDAQP